MQSPCSHFLHTINCIPEGVIIISSILRAFALTLAAGLSTGIGSSIAFLSKKENRLFLSVSLGFSAGVMIYVSMIEMFPKAQTDLSSVYGQRMGSALTVLSFFAGMALIAIPDRILPLNETPSGTQSSSLMKTGIYTALAISIHNFPEGIATFISALREPGVAIPVAAAIAIHNIPEGIAVSVPIYQATGSRARAFFYSFLSGMAEPAGAFLGWILLQPLLAGPALGLLSAAVAGIMVFLSFDELLPSAGAHGSRNSSSCGMTAGMAVMAVSLLLLAVP
ncbi:MAG TPA: zinc transporter ZupT [Candidatus Choladocola avistercoris]|nr:zinc transporter ZupT [Candidatus Choladocola avistercoris]